MPSVHRVRRFKKLCVLCAAYSGRSSNRTSGPPRGPRSVKAPTPTRPAGAPTFVSVVRARPPVPRTVNVILPHGRAAASPRLHGVRYVGGHPGCVEVNRGGLPLRPRATCDPWAFDVILEDAAGLPASGADSNNCAGHVPAIIARLPVCSAPSECAVDLYPSDTRPWRRGGSPLPFPSGGTLWVRGSRVSLTGSRMGPRPARVGRRRDGQPARVRARASSSIFRGQCGRVLCPWYSALANLVVVVGGGRCGHGERAPFIPAVAVRWVLSR